MQELLQYEHIGTLIRIGVLLIIGFPILWMLSNGVRKALHDRIGEHIAALASNIVFYAGLLFITFSILNDLGFNLSALLGAAGIAGIAVGFAAQTTVSNVISGIFLLLEQAFKVGDVVTCDGHIGVVESIDLLSVKMTTFDNQLIRIPNEMFIKKSVINRSFYPNRRLDIKVRVRNESDLEKALSLLESIAQEHQTVLKDPKHLIAISDVSSWATSVLFRVWLKQAEYVSTQRALVAEIKRKCDEAGIHVSVA